ncbi:MAG: CheR family methyltransferase [Myxococcales bacterium]
MAARKKKDPAGKVTPPADAQLSDGQQHSADAEASAIQAPLSPVVPIVAIGASAGGLEALQEFFSKMPPDCGMGFVVVTHVRPGRESLMPELLANVTKMPVIATEDSVRVEPNRIIVAKDSLLDMSDGMLHIATDAPAPPETLYHPIDHFFRALADDQKEHAICIILSGSGNDGTLGLKAIKAAGGMTMVQDSVSAKYTSMPDSAIATGLADYVLSPGQMPAALVEYCRGPYLKLARRAETIILPEDAIQAILVRLRAHTGHDFTCYKRSTMSRRIQRRMNVHHIDQPLEYLRYLRENPRELDILLQELLISVTSFFRDPEAFEALAEKGINRLLSEREDRHTLRVWVPGCATGEEAYSVAILLQEQIRKADRLCEVQIFATDLDEQAIEVARTGLYPEGVAVDIPPQRLAQFFTHEDGVFRIHKNIRDNIVFATQNVISDPPFTRIDMIVCRNLLIYLDGPAQQRVLQAFHYALRPGGILFLGTSETPGEAANLFDVVDGKSKILRRRDVTAHIHPPLAIASRHRNVEPAPDQPHTGLPGVQLSRIIERLLLERFALCAVVVDEHGTILYIHGRSGLYLEPEQGQPRNDIVEMAREGLAPALATVMRQARQDNHEVTRRDIRVRTNGDFMQVDISAKPLTTPEALRRPAAGDPPAFRHPGRAWPPARPGCRNRFRQRRRRGSPARTPVHPGEPPDHHRGTPDR